MPDILANAGGVTVSYFEWVQNKQGYYWTIGQVHERLKEIMSREFNNVFNLMEEKKLDMRTATYAHALSRDRRGDRLPGHAPVFCESRILAILLVENH